MLEALHLWQTRPQRVTEVKSDLRAAREKAASARARLEKAIAREAEINGLFEAMLPDHETKPDDPSE